MPSTNTSSLLFIRESIYRLLPQTTPENINKNFDQYTIDPGTRYPNLNSSCVRSHQVSTLKAPSMISVFISVPRELWLLMKC